MFRSHGTGSSSVVLEENCELIVLIHNCRMDNHSAILLENNGRASSLKRTKNLNISYFFIIDRIKKGDLHIEYCPTDNMVADSFTKPLQGKKFLQFKKVIMNI